jgi:hypothetical protein
MLYRQHPQNARSRFIIMCVQHHKSNFKPITCLLLLAGLSLAFGTREASAAEAGVPSARAAAPELPSRIITLDGKTYEKATLEKVDAYGLLVTFAPVHGGVGVAKLLFRNLPPELRERFGYDPGRAADYEAARARSEAIWSAENAAWAEQKRAAQSEAAAWERQKRHEALVREQARLDAPPAPRQPDYYQPQSWWLGGFGGYNSAPCYPVRSFPHGHNPHQLPVSGIIPSPISRTMGPMRPLGR